MEHKGKKYLILFLIFSVMCFFIFGCSEDRSIVRTYNFKQTIYDDAVWPKELADAEINEMRFHEGDLFLATKKGLVRLDFENNQTIRYQLYSDMPFEWWRSMTLYENKVASTTLVANANTRGSYSGSHIIDIETLELNPLEKRITGHIFHNKMLYQLLDKKLLVRDSRKGFEVVNTIELNKYVKKSCVYGAPLSTDNNIWVPTWGRSKNSNTKFSLDKRKCGLIKVSNDGGVQVINKESAMPYNSTQSSFSDNEGLLLVHPVKAKSVSYFHSPDESWETVVYPSLAGTLSSNYFWLGYRGATGYPRNHSSSRPIRLDSNLQENKFISAIAVRELSLTKIEVWLAYYIKNYNTDGHYSIESSLEKYIVDLNG